MKGKLALEDIKQEVASIAGEYFRKGLNCAESVYQALQKVGLVDFPPDTVAMTTAFGGGIGLSGGVRGFGGFDHGSKRCSWQEVPLC